MRISLNFKKLFSPFWRWALFLVLLPILELFLMITFVKMWLTLLCMLISGIIGMLLAQRECLRCWNELHRQLDRGEMPTSPAVHGILILLAVLFMILPGLLTSLFGLVLLFRIPRSIVASYVELHFNAYRFQPQKRDTPNSPEIIDV